MTLDGGRVVLARPGEVFAGVDISERRGQTIVLLDGATLVTQLMTVPTAYDAAAVLQERGAVVVAIDSPLKPSMMLLRHDDARRVYGLPARQGLNGLVYANYRVCDYELIRRGMPLYQVADDEARCAGWMRVGFALAHALRGAGLREPRDRSDHQATLLEVFPDAAFVTLLGGRPARKSGRDPTGRAQRRSALESAGVRLPCGAGHDALDAAAAAYTALRWRRREGCAVGDPGEGLIVLPAPLSALAERYQRLSSAGSA